MQPLCAIHAHQSIAMCAYYAHDLAVHEMQKRGMDIEWLKGRKKELKITDAALARALGVERSVANKVVNGKTVMNARRVDEVSSLLNVSRDELMYRAGISGTRPNSEPDRHLVAGPGRGKTTAHVDVAQNAISLKQFDLSYSMGPGTNIDDYVEEGTHEFDAELLSKLTRAPSERLFVARADGDSMFPTLLTDDLVVIDTTQKVLNLRDRIWACSIYGAGAIKRLRPAAEGKVEIISDNPSVKDELVDASDVHIVGRVIWLGRRI